MSKVRHRSAHPRLKHKRSRENLRQMYRHYKSHRYVADEETRFELCDAPQRPAVAIEAEYKVKWKNAPVLNIANASEEDKRLLQEVQRSPDFQTAKRIMIQLRSSNILENIISSKDLPAVQKFFKEDIECPTLEVIMIIDHAMEHCYKEVMFHLDQHDIIINAEERKLLLNKEKAKQCLLDVILICPEFMPLRWGGESVGLPSEDDISRIPQSDGSKEVISPWQNAVRRANDQKNFGVSKSEEKVSSEEKISDAPKAKKESNEHIKSQEKIAQKKKSDNSAAKQQDGSAERSKEKDIKKVDRIEIGRKRSETAAAKKVSSAERVQKTSSWERIKNFFFNLKKTKPIESIEKVKKTSSQESDEKVKSAEKAKKVVSEGKIQNLVTEEKMKKANLESTSKEDSQDKLKKVGSQQSIEKISSIVNSEEKVRKISAESGIKETSSEEKLKKTSSDSKVKRACSQEKVKRSSIESKDKNACEKPKESHSGENAKVGLKENVMNKDKGSKVNRRRGKGSEIKQRASSNAKSETKEANVKKVAK